MLAPQLASLTRAPGAPPQAEDNVEQHTDEAMASVALLRMKGKLDRLLPRSNTPGTGSFANGESHPATDIAAGVLQ